MQSNRLREAVNLAGSVASLTGVSLLWLKDAVPGSNLAFAVPVYLVASLLALGLLASAFLVFMFGYKFFLGGFAIPRVEPQPASKIAYAGLAGALIISLTAISLWWIFFLGWTLVRDLPQIQVH